MRKTVAILQSNYIPWKGYFDLINMADEFILYDDVQYTKNDWRNRNRIKTRAGPMWITIPVEYHYPQAIKETVIDFPGWNRKHWKSIVQNYSKARHFHVYKGQFEQLYLASTSRFLSEVNYRFLTTICEILGIDTKISWSMDYDLVEGKTERLVDLCEQAGATDYLSGPSARGYIVEELFQSAGIDLHFMDYSGYPEYDQLFPPFSHDVSILDLIFNACTSAREYMKSF